MLITDKKILMIGIVKVINHDFMDTFHLFWSLILLITYMIISRISLDTTPPRNIYNMFSLTSITIFPKIIESIAAANNSENNEKITKKIPATSLVRIFPSKISKAIPK